jgi:hypothetical protein
VRQRQFREAALEEPGEPGEGVLMGEVSIEKGEFYMYIRNSSPKPVDDDDADGDRSDDL